ncbi:MAG: secondary thiamine-phosphate synthase enzyme YjbQ [Archaeoglobus sp.]|jgi:secondary thiamine-phosphate synthase enzyme|nr:secondary thiamine-phosphate synthase enzyme YjbQ [Archaeoglobus sp.]
MVKAIEVRTEKRTEIVDITDRVEKLLEGSGVALIFTPHTTASIILNEAEEGLLDDILELMEKIAPRNSNYRHNRIDSNADAHLKASILGNSVLVPFENGKLKLGTWQRVLFIEFDGPRNRRVFVRQI